MKLKNRSFIFKKIIYYLKKLLMKFYKKMNRIKKYFMIDKRLFLKKKI